eukprot:3726621-Prymnesium_polylepis.1
MYEESTAKATVKPVVGLTTGSKVQVSNLDFAVTKEDLEVRRRPSLGTPHVAAARTATLRAQGGER